MTEGFAYQGRERLVLQSPVVLDDNRVLDYESTTGKYAIETSVSPNVSTRGIHEYFRTSDSRTPPDRPTLVLEI
jgi:hypothetical protein